MAGTTFTPALAEDRTISDQATGDINVTGGTTRVTITGSLDKADSVSLDETGKLDLIKSKPQPLAGVTFYPASRMNPGETQSSAGTDVHNFTGNGGTIALGNRGIAFLGENNTLNGVTITGEFIGGKAVPLDNDAPNSSSAIIVGGEGSSSGQTDSLTLSGGTAHVDFVSINQVAKDGKGEAVLNVKGGEKIVLGLPIQNPEGGTMTWMQGTTDGSRDVVNISGDGTKVTIDPDSQALSGIIGSAHNVDSTLNITDKAKFYGGLTLGGITPRGDSPTASGSRISVVVDNATYNDYVDGKSVGGDLNVGVGGAEATFTAQDSAEALFSGNLNIGTTQNGDQDSDGIGHVIIDNSKLILDPQWAGQIMVEHGDLTLQNGGILQISGTDSLVVDSTKGKFNASGGVIDVNGGKDFTTAANMNLSGAGLTLDADKGGATLSGVLAGDGGLTKTGANQLTLTGANTYTGETDIDQGTLTLAGNGSLSKSYGVVVDRGTVFDVSDLGKTDGAVRVALLVPVQDLAGNGAVKTGVNTLLINGAFSPGLKSPSAGLYDRMQVAGNIQMASGSTLAANLGPNLQASGADIKGDYTISGDNTTLAVTAQKDAELHVGGKDYVIIHTDGGKVSGTFAKYSQNGGVRQYLDGHAGVYSTGPVYDDTDVRIGLHYDGHGIIDDAVTRNQQASASGLNANFATGGAITDIVNKVAGLGSGERQQALDALSGEVNASGRTAMTNDAFFIRDTAINRLDCADDEFRQTDGASDKARKGAGYCHNDTGRKYTLWGTIYGSQGSNAGRAGWDNARRMNNSSMGWIMGADGLIRQTGVRIGAMLAYGRNWFSAGNGLGSSGSSNNATIGAYAGKAFNAGPGQITTKVGVSYSFDMMHGSRNIRFGDFSGHASSNQLGGTGQVFGETGYRFVVHPAKIPLEIEPFARMTYLNYRQGAFKEHGGSGAALQGRAQDSSMGFSTMGAKVATRAALFGVVFRPHAELGYRRAFGKTESTLRERFRGGMGGWNMSVIGAPVSVDTALLETGVSANVTDRLSLDVNYIGQYGNHLTTSGGTGSVKWRF